MLWDLEDLIIDGSVLILVVIMLALTVAISPIGPKLAVGPQMAALVQLRADMAGVPCPIGEDVAGTVVAWNQKIKSKQAWNERWWAALWIPNEWEEAETIQFPDCER